MFDIDAWQEILYTMRKNKLRTALTAFGVFWGIFMLVMLMGAGKGLENGVFRNFGGEDLSNSFWVWQGRTSVASHGLKPGREIRFTNQDLVALDREIEDLEIEAPRNGLWGEYIVKYKNKNGAFRAYGAPAGFFKINGEKLKAGRFLNELDERERRKVCVIGERVRKVLFGDSTAIGRYIEIQGVFFHVVGTFTSTSNQGRNEERVYIPFTTVQYTYGQQNQVQLLALAAKKGADPSKIKDQVREVLARQHKFAVSDEQAIGIFSNEEEYKQMQGLFWAIGMFVWVVGMGTLTAGVIGVSNIMLIIVKERTREIGVRKALGATPFSIVAQILQESVVITAFSGYMGLLAGAALLDILARLIEMMEAQGQELPFFYKPEINLGIALWAILILVIAGAIAGLIPALQAARVKPIEALRAD